MGDIEYTKGKDCNYDKVPVMTKQMKGLALESMRDNFYVVKWWSEGVKGAEKQGHHKTAQYTVEILG